MESAEIDRKRGDIDKLDDQIVQLLQDRARLAQAIGAAKEANSTGTYAPARERDVLERVRALASDGPLTPEHLGAIFRQVVSACRALERPLRIAYLGPSATFSHEAALYRFGESASFVAVDSIPGIFAEAQRGAADFGVVPVENSTEGQVSLTVDAFIDSDLKVCSEIVRPISLQLLSRVAKDEIRTLYTNPVALGQCRQWLDRSLPGRTIQETLSTARAAAMAAEDLTGAAIAPALAATEYGLNVLERDIQDLAANFTRFYVVGPPRPSESTGRDKSAVLFSLSDRVGALRDVASIFAERGINMSSIQSRPSRRRAWDYVFFVEFEGHEGDKLVEAALSVLKTQCAFVKLIGSWPLD